MKIGVLQVSYRHSPMKQFESLYLSKEQLNRFYKEIQHPEGVVVLMTCNRVEVYFSCEHLEAGKAAILQNLANRTHIPLSNLDTLLTYKTEDTCIQHLFRVACGLQSMIVGENEILGQVKDAYHTALAHKKTNAHLNKAFQAAIALGKKARSESGISKGAYSISSLAIEVIREKRLDYFEKSILLIGIGSMGTRALKKLMALGHPNTTLMNRTKAKADALSAIYPCESIAWTPKNIENYDIVIIATTSKTPLILKETLATSSHPQLFIDLGVPRNVDPALHSVPNKDVLTIESLKEKADTSLHKRKREIQQVESLIDDALTQLHAWQHHSST